MERGSTKPYSGGSGRETPNKELFEQFQKLEEQGIRLQAAIGPTTGDSMRSDKSDSPPSQRARSGPNVTALADISAETKTIAQLREQLDIQGREAERFHQSQVGSGRVLPPPSPCLLENLDIPIRSSGVAGAPQLNSTLSTGDTYKPDRSGSYDPVREVRFKEEIQDLRNQLSDAVQTANSQKEHFRQNVTELKAQLQEAVIARDSVLAKQKYETSGQDAIIQRMHKSIEQLENTNRTQEKALFELNVKLESMQKENYIYDNALAQLRAAMGERERRRGRPYFDSDAAVSQTPTMLVHAAERALQEADADAEGQKDKIRQMTLEIESLRTSLQERTDIHNREQETRLREAKEDYERKAAALTEKITTGERKISSLQEQVSQQQYSSEREVRSKSDHILELEGRLTALRREMDDEQRTWVNKRESLQSALDSAEREMSGMRAERDRAVQQNSATQTCFDDMQKTVEKLSVELSSERSRAEQLAEKESQWRLREERTTLEVKHKEEVIKRLEDSLAAVRREADSQVQHTITSLEKEGKDYIERQISQLKTQLEAMTDRCHKVQLEAELSKADHRNTKEKYDDAKQRCEQLSKQLEEASSKRDSATSMLQDRMGEVERGSKDRDQLSKMLEDRGIELINLKAEKDKLQIQLEEREKNFLSLKQQNENINQIMDSHSHNTLSLRQERDELQARVNEKIIETEEIRHGRDAATTKCQELQRRVEEVTEDNTKLARELQEQQKAGNQGEQHCASLLEELKQSRYEVANLVEARQKLEQQILSNDARFSRDMGKMARKIKGLEKELKLAQQALQEREQVDGKAVKVAGKMQKEVTEKRGQIDSLQTRLRWLEECLDAALKEKKALQEESEQLSQTIKTSTQQSERLSAQLKESMTRNAEELDVRSKLEAKLEKATLKESASQGSIEQLQQDIARLKLKHQLEMKEALRSGKAHKQDSLPPDAYKPSTAGTSAKGLPFKIITVEKAAPAQAKHDLDLNPVSIKPQQGGSSTSEADPAMGKELRTLLDEMKGLIQGQHKHRHKHKRSASPSPESEFDDTYYSSSARKPSSSHRSKAQHRRPGSKSSFSGSHRAPPPRSLSPPSHRAASPVSDLMLGTTYQDLEDGDDTEYTCSMHDFDSLQQLTMDVSSVKDYLTSTYPAKTKSKPPKGSSSSGKARGPGPLAPDTQALAKRLEKKIENLTRIGGRLQSENKEVSRMVKDSEKRIQRVKGQMGKS